MVSYSGYTKSKPGTTAVGNCRTQTLVLAGFLQSGMIVEGRTIDFVICGCVYVVTDLSSGFGFILGGGFLVMKDKTFYLSGDFSVFGFGYIRGDCSVFVGTGCVRLRVRTWGF